MDVEIAVVFVLGVLVIAMTTVLAERLRVAGPLLLVAIGAGVGLLPFLDIGTIPPEIILGGVLPPLLYASAVRLPALEFRRDVERILGLSVLLVIVTALLLGLFFWALIPGISFPLAVALGAILSPTDAVATAIAKPLGVPRRVITMLEGESLLNDATSLVLLRTAIAAIAGGFSLGSSVGEFAWAVLIAVIVGALVGWVNLRLHDWIANVPASTAISFTIPFVAYVPTEHLGGSGLVAAVIAGIVTGQGSTRHLRPQQRLAEEQNWRTVELVLEGAVFLVMGLELNDIVNQNVESGYGIGGPLLLAGAALVIVLVVRAGWVTGLIGILRLREKNMDRTRLEAMQARFDDTKAEPDLTGLPPRWQKVLAQPEPPQGPRRETRMQRMRRRISGALADYDYYEATSLGWRHGVVIVWGGMRGVVTLAAAQTLSEDDTGQRALLVFIAFLVAAGSLALQGFTLPWVVRMLRFPPGESEDADEVERKLRAALNLAAAELLDDPSLRREDGTAFDPTLLKGIGTRMTTPPEDEDSARMRDGMMLRSKMLDAMRDRLNRLSRGGEYSSELIRRTHDELDAEQLSLQLRLEGE